MSSDNLITLNGALVGAVCGLKLDLVASDGLQLASVSALLDVLNSNGLILI